MHYEPPLADAELSALVADYIAARKADLHAIESYGAGCRDAAVAVANLDAALRRLAATAAPPRGHAWKRSNLPKWKRKAQREARRLENRRLRHGVRLTLKGRR